MAHKITVKQLKALLNDNMGALGLQRDEAVRRNLVPKEYGDPGYTAQQRLDAVGLTFADLKEAGLGLQSESHGVRQGGRQSPQTVRHPNYPRHTPDELKAWQAAFRQSYRDQHGGRDITPVCTGTTTPSGIVPYTPPDKARAAQLTEWHAALIASLVGKDDNAIAEIPAVGATPGTGNLLPGVTTTPKAKGSAQQPTMWLAFYSGLAGVKNNLSGMLANLQAADDQSQVGQAINDVKEYIELLPESLGKITQAAFDTSQIRPGVEVNLIQGTGPFNVARSMLKTKLGIEVDATTVFTVTGPRLKEGVQIGWEFQPKGHEPLRNPLFCMVTEGQPSALKRVVKAPPVVVTWKAAAGELAMFGPDQVVILDVTGEIATVYYLDDEVAMRQGHDMGEEGSFQCALAQLSKPV